MTYLIKAKNCQETFDVLEACEADYTIDWEDTISVDLEFDGFSQAEVARDELNSRGLILPHN